ncbi:alpha/beta fold hydrolase [Nonomuraea africana]|uniref:Pimeloyl-ACP methyl ester carboxylesterase n=1 Tax=Nonomuraea africana TaxID=46171 RepID=A0ABR9KRF1_9ACTN|nr:alpha/beta hydrolase [Nonomuraea africana]MBE1564610.1 pimeloyl-ACP methyl ester carboxylesterase [Nonomuraea africana]
MTGTVTSADGTRIAFDRSGSGPAVILVHGAFTDRSHPTLSSVAAALAPWFTVFNYDRRGRGASGDTRPYAVRRELEDLDAIIETAGGSAMVFGGSSGAALALEATARNPAISKLALWEPPYHVDDTAPCLPYDFGSQLEALIRQDRRAEAIGRFMVEAAELPVEAVAAMRAEPSWPELEAVAHTLAYEAAVMGPGNALPMGTLAAIARPTLVLNGESSPAWMGNAGRAVAKAVPGAVHRILEGQTHNVAAQALAPELLEFFVA